MLEKLFALEKQIHRQGFWAAAIPGLIFVGFTFSTYHSVVQNNLDLMVAMLFTFVLLVTCMVIAAYFFKYPLWIPVVVFGFMLMALFPAYFWASLIFLFSSVILIEIARYYYITKHYHARETSPT